MNIEILNESEAPLFKRKNYTLKVEFTGATPSRAALAQAASKQLKAKPDVLVVRRIKQEFGDTSSEVEVSVYSDAKALGEFEASHMKKRHESLAEKPEDESEPQAQEQAEQKEEAPESKEEAPTEEKAEKEPEKAEDAPEEKTEGEAESKEASKEPKKEDDS